MSNKEIKQNGDANTKNSVSKQALPNVNKNPQITNIPSTPQKIRSYIPKVTLIDVDNIKQVMNVSSLSFFQRKNIFHRECDSCFKDQKLNKLLRRCK